MQAEVGERTRSGALTQPARVASLTSARSTVPTGTFMPFTIRAVCHRRRPRRRLRWLSPAPRRFRPTISPTRPCSSASRGELEARIRKACTVTQAKLQSASESSQCQALAAAMRPDAALPRRDRAPGLPRHRRSSTNRPRQGARRDRRLPSCSGRYERMTCRIEDHPVSVQHVASSPSQPVGEHDAAVLRAARRRRRPCAKRADRGRAPAPARARRASPAYRRAGPARPPARRSGRHRVPAPRNAPCSRARARRPRAPARGCAMPRNSGSREGWMLSIRPAQRSTKPGREHPHEAGEADELDAARRAAPRRATASKLSRSGKAL